jgi:RNA polymerase sigma-70 factor (ECF subfamily)
MGLLKNRIAALHSGTKDKVVVLQEAARRKYEGFSDHRLMELCCEGDKGAFNEIVLRYKDPLVNFVYHLVDDYGSAKDIAQEAFIRAYLNAHRYKPIASFSTWLYQIAKNLAYNAIKKRKRYFKTSINDPLYPDSPEVTRDLEDNRRRPDEELENNELSSLILTTLRSIPHKYRVPIVLRDIEGFSYEEIAEILRCPKGTVKSRINRGRRLMRAKMEPFV